MSGAGLRSAGANRLRGSAWLVRIALVVLPALALLGGADLLFRLRPSRVDLIRELIIASPDERGYRLRPNTTIRFDGLFARLPEPVVWRINAQGLREDRLVPAHGDRFRIATYGDSETFGWSVDQADTFQRQMEARDERLEVINFGVPGYNVTNIAQHVEATLPAFAPDLVIYVVNKNDLDEPLMTTRTIADSPLLRRLRLLYRMVIAKRARVRARYTSERGIHFAHEVERLIRFGEENGVPVLLAYLQARIHGVLHRHGSSYLARAQPARFGNGAAPLPRFIDVERLIENDSRADDHLTAVSYRKTAQRLCQILTGAVDAGCVPGGWRPHVVRAETGIPRDQES